MTIIGGMALPIPPMVGDLVFLWCDSDVCGSYGKFFMTLGKKATPKVGG